MDEPEVRERLGGLAPALRSQPLTRATMGAERNVWFVGDEHVLRVAPDALSLARMRVERRLLRRLDGVLPVRTPVVIAVASDEKLDICRKAPGEAMDWQQWARLARQDKRRLCVPLGRFVAALHEAVPAAEARKLGVAEYSPVDPAHLREGLAARLRTSSQRMLLDTVTDLIPSLTASSQREALLHNDLSHHNIAFDQSPLVMTGVFDFASSAVGDPHRDLRYDPALEFGEDAMLRAYEQARGVEMSAGRQRTWHAVSALENLLWSLGNEGEVLQASRWGWVDAVAAWAPSVLTS